jgi:hypothetical protein
MAEQGGRDGKRALNVEELQNLLWFELRLYMMY